MKKLGGLALLSPLSVYAAAPDVTAITGAVADAGTAAALVGAAVVVMLVSIKVYKWLRRAM